MIKVYCLINPLTGNPFYVGATKGRLSTRLSQHIGEAMGVNTYYIRSISDDKKDLIRIAMYYQERPTAKLLYSSDSLFDAGYYEEFFYNLFTLQGYTLLQKKPSGYAQYINNCRFYLDNGLSLAYKDRIKAPCKVINHVEILYFIFIAKNIW
jgi:hypothetical protein